MKRVLLVLLLISILCYGYWEDIHNSDNWQRAQLYSINLKGEMWEKSDIRLPTGESGRFGSTEYKAAIAHHYRLKREAYIVDIDVNPTGRSGQVALQILTTHQPDTQQLRVEPRWNGSCALMGPLSKNGTWNTEADKLQSIGFPFFTNPKAIGFLWYPTTGYCIDRMLETAEQASSFPIELKIFDGSMLIGEEQIDFEIFKNGIKKYVVMP